MRHTAHRHFFIKYFIVATVYSPSSMFISSDIFRSMRVWKGGPDTTFPLLFHKNPASHTVFHHYPESRFSLPEKYIVGSCKKEINSFVYLSMMKEHNTSIMTSGFSPRHLLLAIFANIMKVMKCVTKLNRLLCSSPLSRTLNFS